MATRRKREAMIKRWSSSSNSGDSYFAPLKKGGAKLTEISLFEPLLNANSRRLFRPKAPAPLPLDERDVTPIQANAGDELHITLSGLRSYSSSSDEDAGPDTPSLTPDSPSCSSDASSSSDEAISPRSSLRGDSPPASLRTPKKREAFVIPTRSSSIANDPLANWLIQSDALLLSFPTSERNDVESEVSSLASWRTPSGGSETEDDDDSAPSLTPPTSISPSFTSSLAPKRKPVPTSSPAWRFEDLCSLSCTSTSERIRRYEARIAALRAADVQWWLDGQDEETTVVARAQRATWAAPRRVPVPLA